MPSSFSWLDFSDEQRQKTMDILALFRESDTVDELGIGVVRDTFSDLLFPGTSTIQTRAKYFLFIPWIYRDLERYRIPSRKINSRARQEEVQLIYSLLENGENEGVIGSLAKSDLQRLPSRIYWNGLEQWGIRRFPGPLSQYHRSLDGYYASLRYQNRNDDGDLISGGPLPNWHLGLPDAPADFPESAVIDLTKKQASYLQERLLSQVGGSLLTYLVDKQDPVPASRFPWSIPLTENLLEPLNNWLVQARNFSELIWGAPLLYNLMLSELIGNEEYIERYQGSLAEWAYLLRNRWDDFTSWDRNEFWVLVEKESKRVPLFTKNFINDWWGLALSNPEGIQDQSRAKDLIRNRERLLKRGQARLFSQRARELWGGAAGTGQIDYRWNSGARQIINDIIAGLNR